MSRILLKLFQLIFCRRFFYPLNRFLYLLSLHGLGYLNSQDFKISGELWLLNIFFRDTSNKTVFDVGANTGAYSALVKKLNPNVSLYAFEPHPISYQALKDCSAAHNFQAYHLGFSDQLGQAQLHDLKDGVNSELASLHAQVFSKIHQQESVAYTVDLDTIDNFCANQNIHNIDLLKIDTEGHEYAVLRGATQLLQNGRVKVIQFEFNEMNVASKVFLKDFIDLLVGYRFFILLSDGLEPIKYSPVKSEIFAFCNIVAVREDYLHKLNS
jgi:FkbM family methyltransferase